MKKILLVDDDKINNFLSTLIINNSKIAKVCKECFNGQEAIDFLESAAIDDLPDIILLDLNMPVLDGWQFLDFFMKMESNSLILIYILTSSNYDADMSKAKSYSCVKDYIVKPLKKEILLDILES
jgi:CheY-like chemotaxis protein